MTRRFAVASALVMLLVSPARAADPAGEAKPNKLTAAEAKAGWKLLFDGKSTKGWRGYKSKTVPAVWVVKDGALVYAVNPAGKGDLLTVGQYESFELAIDWKISEGGNSGIMYHVQETESVPWQTGPEVQILDNSKHQDGKSPMTSAGSCYALYPPSKDVTRPVGEWNQARVVVNGSSVEHWLNGEKVVSYEKGSADWNEKVAASKFKGFPRFGKATKGFIDLQDHDNPVEFRNIKLRVLHPVKSASN